MPEHTVVIESIVEPEQYNLVEGQNNKFTINSNQNLIFKTDGKYNLFEGIKIDNNLISKENYKVEEGSTIITLNASYLNYLTVGKHKLDILYTNGTVVSSDFEILSNMKQEKDETPKMGSTTTDNTFLFIGLIVISLVGIITTKKYKK